VALAYDVSRQRAFTAFLEWLSPDPDEAGRRYIEIHAGLVRVFSARGCDRPEELADLTLDRVIGKIHEVAPSYIGQPAAYIHGVAKRIVLEHRRSKRRVVPAATFLENFPAPPPAAADLEWRHECLERALRELSPEERELILTYYGKRGFSRVESRRGLAREAQVSQAALRKRTQRIRERLKWSLEAALRHD
jgi:RNA polymerase sigma factor (sigma-70 family)